MSVKASSNIADRSGFRDWATSSPAPVPSSTTAHPDIQRRRREKLRIIRKNQRKLLFNKSEKRMRNNASMQIFSFLISCVCGMVNLSILHYIPAEKQKISFDVLCSEEYERHKYIQIHNKFQSVRLQAVKNGSFVSMNHEISKFCKYLQISNQPNLIKIVVCKVSKVLALFVNFYIN